MFQRAFAPNKVVAACGTVIMLLCLWTTGCREGGGEKPTEASPTPTPTPTAKVSVVASPLITLEVGCDDYAELWAGPSSNVFVKLTGTNTCPVKLMLEDKTTHKLQPTGNTSTNPAGDPAVQVRVTNNFALLCDCGGEGRAKCKCEITRVDPDLPAGTVLGPPATIPAGATQKNPATAPPAGTKVELDCGQMNLPLWTGTSSYVTVTFQGTPNCTAHVTGRLTGQAGSEETVDKQPFCRTFGPINELKASCVGAGGQKCEFQVTEVVQLP